MTLAPALQHDRRLVAWLSLSQLISWGSIFYLFSLLMEPVERELGLSRAQSSLAFSIALLVEGLMAYPVGRWIDRGHERVVMSAGSVLAGLCLALLGSVTSQWGFYAIWAGLGVAMSAILYTPVFAVVTRRFALDFRRAIITMTFLGGLASTVFIPLIAWLMAHLGWRQSVLVLAALQWGVCLPLHLMNLHGAPARPVRHIAEGAEPAQGTPGQLARQGFSQHLLSPAFWLIGSFVVLTMAVTVALPAHMVSLLRENGLNEAWVIAIPASMGVIQVLGRLLMFFFEHHFDMHLANRLIPSLIPVGLVALLLVPLAPLAGALHTALLIGFVLLYGMGNGMLTIVKGTAIAQYVSREHMPRLSGALGLPQALARAASPWLLGVMWTPQVGYTYGLWLLLGLSVVGLTALVWAQRLSKQ
jgi:MFS family permease